MKTLTITWKAEEGVVYRNGNESINYNLAMERARAGEYSEISFSWEGMIPVDIYKELSNRKTLLQKMAIQ